MQTSKCPKHEKKQHKAELSSGLSEGLRPRRACRKEALRFTLVIRHVVREPMCLHTIGVQLGLQRWKIFYSLPSGGFVARGSC